MMMPNRVRVPISDDSELIALDVMVASTAMKPPRSTTSPPSQASTTGSRKVSFCMNDTVSSPVSEEAVVASRMGRNTRVGSDAHCWARYIDRKSVGEGQREEEGVDLGGGRI